MRTTLLLALVTIMGAAGVSATESYTNRTVLRVWPQSEQDRLVLQSIKSVAKDLMELWDEPRNGSILFADLAQTIKPFVLGQLKANKVRFQVATSNMQEWVDKQKAGSLTGHSHRHRRDSSTPTNYNYESYQRFEVIHQQLKELAERNPQLTELKAIGKSVDDRDLAVLIIGKDATKPTIFLECGIHARYVMVNM